MSTIDEELPWLQPHQVTAELIRFMFCTANSACEPVKTRKQLRAMILVAAAKPEVFLTPEHTTREHPEQDAPDGSTPPLTAEGLAQLPPPQRNITGGHLPQYIY